MTSCQPTEKKILKFLSHKSGGSEVAGSIYFFLLLAFLTRLHAKKKGPPAPSIIGHVSNTEKFISRELLPEMASKPPKRIRQINYSATV